MYVPEGDFPPARKVKRMINEPVVIRGSARVQFRRSLIGIQIGGPVGVVNVDSDDGDGDSDGDGNNKCDNNNNSSSPVVRGFNSSSCACTS